MSTATAGQLLRVYLCESQRCGDRPLHEAIVMRAREVGLAGATVLRGPMGYGRHHRMHTAKILQLAMDLPLLVEIVDTPERLAAFLPVLRELAPQALATLEEVRIVPPREED